MNVYVVIQHVCEADCVIGVCSSEECARAAMTQAHEEDPMYWCSIELWTMDGECLNDNVANS